MMPRKPGRGRGLRVEARALVIVAVLALGVLGLALYLYGQGCNVTVQSVCLTTGYIYINASGDCGALEARIIDVDGFVRAQAEVPLNESKVPITPGIAPGEYTVELYANGRLVASVPVRAYQESYLVSANALLLPNGTLIIDTQGYTSPCTPDYGIAAIRVVVNETTYDFTDQFWPVGERIVLNLDVEVTPNMFVNVFLFDSNGNIIQAKVRYPQ